MRPSTCSVPRPIKIRIDLDALTANRQGAEPIRPIWWVQLPDGREIRAHEVLWQGFTATRYKPAGTQWNLTDRVSAWLDVKGPVLADGTWYQPEGGC